MNYTKLHGFLTSLRLKSPIIVFTFFGLAACTPSERNASPPFLVDLLPPVLTSATNAGVRELRFLFDEEVLLDHSKVVIQPALAVSSSSISGKNVSLILNADQIIGQSYQLRMSISDKSGNSLSFIYKFSGWNPEIPQILVNELNPKGSGKAPDCVELFAVTDGNLGGLVLRVGTQNRFSDEFVFPAIRISGGDYIVVHTKPEGIKAEIDELSGVDESGGLLATDTARDFWMRGASGLPGNNGAVTLFERAGGPLIDAVLWSNRSNNENDKKLGWTSEGFIFAMDLGQNGGWTGVSEGIPRPSDAVDSSYTTGTRSLSRSSDNRDSDRRDDWHTVPTRGSSFGEVNSDEVHKP